MAEGDLETRAHARRLTLFSVSAAMVGVCLTGIGLLNIMSTMRRIETLGDELLSVAAILFLASSALSFVSMNRRREHLRRDALVSIADGAFFIALALVLIVCGVITVGL